MQVSSLDWVYPRLARSFDRWRTIERSVENLAELARARVDLEEHRAMARQIAANRRPRAEPEVIRKFDVDTEVLYRFTRALGRK